MRPSADVTAIDSPLLFHTQKCILLPHPVPCSQGQCRSLWEAGNRLKQGISVTFGRLLFTLCRSEFLVIHLWEGHTHTTVSRPSYVFPIVSPVNILVHHPELG